jgi:DNA-binding transcriptional LysR family regulator
MEIIQIEAFLALCEELHFGRASQRLFVSQSVVSRRVAALEREIGGDLFERTSRRVRLTPLGAAFRDRLRPVYFELAFAFSEASGRARDAAGELRVGFTTTTEGPALSRLLKSFQARYPRCTVILREVDVFDPYAALRRDEVDACYNYLPIGEPDLTAGPALEHYSQILAVAPEHRLASRTTVSIEDVAGEQVIARPPGFPASLYDMFLPRSTPAGRPLHRTQRVQTVKEILSLTAQGRIVHPTTRLAAPERDDIVTVPISDMPSAAIGLIWRTSQENSRIRSLADFACSRSW